MDLLISVFWFFLPAGIANMVPVLFAWVPFDTPVDFGHKLWGQPIFGPHKTYRGFIAGVLFAIMTVALQKVWYPHPVGNTIVDYSGVNVIWLGCLLGFGALLGDLVKSFFKRRLKLPSGWLWAPFDQIDWIIGASLLASFAADLKIKHIIAALVLFGLLHPVVNLIGYFLHVKSNKF